MVVQYESGGTRERIVSVAQPGTVCEGAPKIEVEQSSGYREVHESARSTTTTGTATSATTGTATTGTTGAFLKFVTVPGHLCLSGSCRFIRL